MPGYQWSNDGPEEAINTTEDLLRMLDSLFRDEGGWWDRFYADRKRNIPFFVNAPEGNGGSDITDWQVYRDRSMHRGLGYSQRRLRGLFEGKFDVLELRRMRKIEQPNPSFGEPFLWVGLFRKK